MATENKRKGLNNKNTRFSKFTWGEDKKRRDAIQRVREEMGTLPLRFKIKL